MASVFERIIKIIEKQLDIEKEQITKDTSFTEDLGADSIDKIELVMAFETEFGIDIPEDDVSTLHKISDAVKYIEAVLKK